MNSFILSTLYIYLTGKGFDPLMQPRRESEAVGLIKGKLLPSEVATHTYFKI